MPGKGRPRPPPKRLRAGVRGTAIVRTRGDNRHVTIYPLLQGKGHDWTVRHQHDYTLHDAEMIIKQEGWQVTDEWTGLEPGVYVTKVVKT